MAQIRHAALDHEARRWLRHDWRRFFNSGSRNDPLYRYYERIERKYNPSQPRVPAGQPEGGQWTSGTDPSAGSPSGDEPASKIQLASSEPPKLGRRALAAILFEMAKKAIDAYRSENGLLDLFNRREGTVSYTNFKGTDIFGSNSTSPTYTVEDRQATIALRQALIEKYPDIFGRDNIGQMPNDVFFHAEANALVRAARQNGGSLAGEELEIYVDRRVCNNCPSV